MHDSKFSVWIESEAGAVYQEHEYINPAIGRTECWIESKQGETFVICFKPTVPSEHCIQASFWLDGISVASCLTHPGDTLVTKWSGARVGSSVELPFNFGKQNLTDDETIASRNDPSLSELSTIRVTIRYSTLLGYTSTPPLPPNLRGAVHEQAAKKAHGDMAGLGAPKASRAINQWCRTKVLPELGTAEFVFHYAPSTWLRAHEIITEPLVEALADDHPDDFDIKLEPRRKRAHSAEPEANDSDDSDIVVLSDLARPPPNFKNKKRARVEKKPAKAKAAVSPTRPLDTGEVIDLASDSD
ncbi:hypothetical protein BDV93DRAFT_522282 [Ceratobasidium sp. AG-I]|nr:hypothetical protein BDV93DRAFT_522282 [Ceratobasidium sp. AG-I]